MIDDLRLSRENLMLHDLQEAANTGGDLECRARQGETPVRLLSVQQEVNWLLRDNRSYLLIYSFRLPYETVNKLVRKYNLILIIKLGFDAWPLLLYKRLLDN